MLKLIDAPAIEPVTLAELKAQCRVDGTDENALLTALISTAREQAEHELGRALITQTWRLTVDAFPCVELELGKPDVQGITSVVYTDTAGADQTLDSAAYVLDTSVSPGWLLPAYGYTWPSTLDTAGAVRVTFTCGYGDDAASVPAGIKTWILMRAATLFKFREEIAAGVSVTELPGRFFDRLLDPWRVYGV